MKNSNISFSEFVDSFPESYQKNFSYEGKRALFNYLEEYEESTGQEIENDPIAFCCEYAEYKNLKEIKKDYSSITTMESLEDRTQVIEFDGGIIIQSF